MLPVDFTEDETVSIVRPVAPREDRPSASAPGPAAEEDDSSAVDFFATTLLPTRPDVQPSRQVQPPADFRPPSDSSTDPATRPETTARESTAPEDTAHETTVPGRPSETTASEITAPEPAAAQLDFGADSSDEFNISFGEEEPAKQEDANIWSAYGNEETAGWGTTSFEAQAPLPSTPKPATPEPTPGPEPAAPGTSSSQTGPAVEAPASAESDAGADLESTGWGAGSGWSSETGWGSVEAPAEQKSEPGEPLPAELPLEPGVAEPPAPSLEPAEPQTAAPQPASDFGSESVWEVPSFEEESEASQVAVPAEVPSNQVQPPADFTPSFGAETDDVSASEPEASALEAPAPSAPAPEPTSPEPPAPEFSSSDAPTFDADPLAEAEFQPAHFDAGPSLQEDPELELESTFAAPPESPPAPTTPESAPEPEAPAASDAGTSFDSLSSELGAEDTGSFHTALQGVLQIRGEDGEGTKADDHGVPFGDYRLLERVAVGGMAEVWRARRRGVEGFQKTVAIKRILSHLTGSTDFISMFIDEAKLAAQLNHANIAQIYDLGKVDEDFYIAMEFVEGRDLRTLLREAKQKSRPLPLGQAIFIIAAVARGLDYAHRKRDFEDRDLGLVHRDVSPQNVLVSTEGEIKLCDFGIVKAVAKASTTQMGALKGKLQYMSPEQAWGKEVDGRSDIFSLGTVMFEALTGEKLFTGDSEIGVLDAVRDCRLKSARAIDPSIPESVEAILEKTLQASPEDRYQTAGEMERDLQSVIETLKPSPGQSDLSKYMHNLVEAPEPGEDDSAFVATGSALTGAGNDGSAGAWTGTSWGTASFYEQAPESDATGSSAVSEPVSAKIPVSGKVRVGEPVTSKPPEPVSARPAPMSSSKIPIASSGKVAGKKSGGKLIWVLLVLTMLAIVAVVAWTQFGGKQATQPGDGAPVAAPAETPTSGTQPAEGDGEAEGEETVDQEELMQQMIQEEMDRKKKEMEEQFEAQKRELERRMKEVEGDG